MKNEDMSNMIIPSVKSYVQDQNSNIEFKQLLGIYSASVQQFPDLVNKLKLFIAEFFVATGVQLSLVETLPAETDRYIQFSVAGEVSEALYDEYTIVVNGQGIAVEAPTIEGVFYATRTLLQFAQRGPVLNYGEIHDYSQIEERGLLLDVARKYLSLPWIKKMVDQLAAIKMNALQLHLSDNQGFRMETSIDEEKYGVSFESSTVLTKSDIAELIDYASDRCVAVIPDFDSPGHMDNIIKTLKKADPETYQGISYELPAYDVNLKVTNPVGVQVISDIIDEWIGSFNGCPAFHVGGDEYFATLLKQATHDEAITYLNQRAAQVVASGMEARIWNDEIFREGGTIQPDTSTVICYWSSSIIPFSIPFFGGLYAPVTQLISAGYNLINANQNYLYYTPQINTSKPNERSNQYDKTQISDPKPEAIYNQWTPMVFAGNSADFEAQQKVDSLQQIRGAMYCIWCDNADSIDENDIYDKVKLALRAMAEKSWGKGSEGFDYNTFVSLSDGWEPIH
ncbi:glycoside hydrolase family 20 protein [Mixta tenebrionis]|uniref:N-acetyl-beta-glucosaminidase n=1 Tax=Mixta tenebrionis TaxID=2562439 RepID=A0A506VFV2_9GAMM|nr:glycoside hydrolase family 20 protein [Mixta tenebrionis]TPW44199.1 family 20 glycosylhydrolase [Mixta tenebrionis]